MIRGYTKGLDSEEFYRDSKTKDAVCMRIIAIAESAKKLLEKYPKDLLETRYVPWKELAGMRNRIAHDYGGVDYKIVWEVCAKDIPELERLVKEFKEQI